MSYIPSGYGGTIQEHYDLIKCMQRYVYIDHVDRIADITDPDKPLKTLQQLGNELMSFPHTFVGDDGKSKTVPMERAWMKDPMKRVVANYTFAPGEDLFFDRGGRPHLNSYHPLKIPEAGPKHDEYVEIFTEHVKLLFGDATDMFLDWVAHAIQDPGTRPHFHWYHISRQHGVGRGTLSVMLAGVFGRYGVSETALSNLTGTAFNAQLSRKLYVGVGEIEGGGGNLTPFQLAQAIKQILTTPVLEINEKYQPKQTEDFVARVFLMSNSPNALPIEEMDRRLYVADIDVPPPNKRYLDRLYAVRSSEEFHHDIRLWLSRRDVSKFNPGFIPPVNTAKKAAQEAYTSTSKRIARAIRDCWPLDIVASHEVYNVWVESGVKTRAIGFAYSEVGIVKVHDKQIRLADGSKSFVYAVRNHDRWVGADIQEIKDEIAKMPAGEKRDIAFLENPKEVGDNNSVVTAFKPKDR